MSVSIQVFDETTTGECTNELVVDLLSENITVRELIRSRVYQEVKDYNVRAFQKGEFRGLVQPGEVERTLNNTCDRRVREIDWQKQYEIALDAFNRNGFIVLIDDYQAESLDEEIHIKPETRISFLKLVPLVGG